MKSHSEIWAARKNRSMTRADLARIVGVSGQTIYRWEVGLSWLPPLQALKIARELGIEIRYDCPSCEMRIAVSGRGIEPAGDQKIRALLRSAYLMIDDLPIGDVALHGVQACCLPDG